MARTKTKKTKKRAIQTTARKLVTQCKHKIHCVGTIPYTTYEH